MNAAPFTPLAPRATVVEACADALRASILEGRFAPGARLPPERQLAESFGVNRVTVRQALARLESARLVSVRQGSGYVVRDFRREGGPDLLEALVASAQRSGDERQSAADLFCVRRAMARAVLERLVASPPRRAALTAISEGIDALERAARENAPVEELAAHDLAIISSVVEATGSTVLRLCLNPVARLLSRLPALQRAMYRRPMENVASYRLLAEWLRAPTRDGVDAIVAELERHDAAAVAALARAPKRSTP